VLEQFNRVFSKFRVTVKAFPEDEWRAGDSAYQRPAGLAAHFLSTIDYYTSDLSADQFPWRKRLGVDWETEKDDLLPSKGLILDYLVEMEKRVARWTARQDLSAVDELHPYCGQTLLGRAIYVLRHSESHLAEMSLELRRRGYLGPEWR
jgi:hypothetical protein